MDREQYGLRTPSLRDFLQTAGISGVTRVRTSGNASLALECLQEKSSIIMKCMKARCVCILVEEGDREAPITVWPAKIQGMGSNLGLCVYSRLPAPHLEGI